MRAKKAPRSDPRGKVSGGLVCGLELNVNALDASAVPQAAYALKQAHRDIPRYHDTTKESLIPRYHERSVGDIGGIEVSVIKVNSHPTKPHGPELDYVNRARRLLQTFLRQCRSFASIVKQFERLHCHVTHAPRTLFRQG